MNMKQYIVILLIGIAATVRGEPIPVEPTLPDGYYPITRDRKRGFINRDGMEIIPPRYFTIDGFTDGLSPVTVENGGKHGYIDTNGNLVIEAKFDNALHFIDGLAHVRIGDVDRNWQVKPPQRFIFGKHGYIDKTGAFAIQPRFDLARAFSDGLAAVNVGGTNGWDSGGKWGYIDGAGKVVIDFKFDDAWNFYNGRAVVGLGKISQQCGGKWGMIDRQGGYIVEPTYDWIFNRPEGGHFSTKRDGKFGYISVQGQVIAPQFEEVGTFNEGLAPVKLHGRWRVIDEAGNFPFEETFDHCRGFSDGMAAVNNGGKWGYINPNGEIAVPPRFDEVYGFREGLSAVLIQDKIGFINKKGDFVVDPTFDRSWDFPPVFWHGLAAVRRGDRWGYVDRNGKTAIEFRYRGAMPFWRDMAMVSLSDGTSAWIDRTGRIMWSEKKTGAANRVAESTVPVNAAPSASSTAR